MDSNDLINQQAQLQLQRNGVIALINLLSRLSESVQALHDLSPIDKDAINDGQISASSLHIVIFQMNGLYTYGENMETD